jgi:DNA-binding response OmpR family regulator
LSTPTHPVRMFPLARIVLRGAEELDLTRLEFDLLLFLAEHPLQVFRRSQLLSMVWGHSYAGTRTVDVHVRRLRAKAGSSIITTVRGVGYRLDDPALVEVVPGVELLEIPR